MKLRAPKIILDQSGMTLIEMILVIAFAGIVLTASVVAFRPILNSWALAQSRSEAENQVQFAIDRIATEIASLRDANSVLTAVANDFRFTDVSNTTIRFYLSGSNLMRNNDVLARGVQSLAFTYTNVNEGTLASPAVSPSATNIWRVKVRVGIQKGNQSVTMESQVQPRNLVRS